jgi:hypothetical protein
MKIPRRSVICARLAAMLVLSLLSCGKNDEAVKARAALLADAQGRLEAAKAALGETRDDATRVVRLREILKIEAIELGDAKGALKYFDDNEKLLAADVQSRIFVAVGESMQAGKEKKIENKLAWLRKGMRSFERLGEEFPGDEMVRLYQASTYANFPAEVGASAETLDILEALRADYLDGTWALTAGAARQLAYIYENLEKNNIGAESVKEIKASRDAAAASLPLFAKAIAPEGGKP